MLQIGDIVTVKSSPGIPATITGVLHEKSETYTLTDEVVNGRYVWARETITIYGLDDGPCWWADELLQPTGERRNVQSHTYNLGDKVRLLTEGEGTTWVVEAIRHRTDGYEYELNAPDRASRRVGEAEIASTDAYTLF